MNVYTFNPVDIIDAAIEILNTKCVLRTVCFVSNPLIHKMTCIIFNTFIIIIHKCMHIFGAVIKYARNRDKGILNYHTYVYNMHLIVNLKTRVIVSGA